MGRQVEARREINIPVDMVARTEPRISLRFLAVGVARIL